MLLDAGHSLAMLELATEADFRFGVLDVEVQRGGPSYTIDTVRELVKRWPDSEICFIIGTDSLLELHMWKDIYELLELCTFVSLRRPGLRCHELETGDLQLDPPWPQRLLANMSGGPLIEISSSNVRHRVAEGLSIRYLVPESVEIYIAEHGLYGGRIAGDN